MKITTFILITVILQVSASTFAQKITLSEKNTSLINVLEKIRLQSGYDFMFSTKVLADANTVTINVKDTELKDALELIFKSQPLTYKIEAQSVSISRKEPSFLDKLVGSVTADRFELIDIKGKVVNQNNETLPGALIKIKGTNRAVIADANGNFAMQKVDDKAILVVSYIGYESQEVKAAPSMGYITLKPTTNALDQVVVQGYGTTTDRLRTGNIATVTKEIIEKQPVSNVLQALQGRVPGLIISQQNGYESAPFKVELRGRTAINPDLLVQPLFIIDGVPFDEINNSGGIDAASNGLDQNNMSPAGGQSPLFSINPKDIESISVLKDADALAIYGSKGANGVILITTKKGQAGKTKLDAEVNNGVNMVTRRYEMLNTQQYIAMRQEAFKNSNIVPNAGNAFDFLVWDTTRYTDLQDLYWGDPGKRLDLQFGLSGGEKNTTFRIGGSALNSKELNTYTGGDKRIGLQFSLNHKNLNQRLSISLTGFYAYVHVNQISLGGRVTAAPNIPPIYDEQGHLNYAGYAPARYLFGFGSLLRPYSAKTGILNSNLKVQYQLVKGLNLSASLGYGESNIDQRFLTPIISEDPIYNPTGSAQFGSSSSRHLIFEPQTDYKFSLGRGELSALIGLTLHPAELNKKRTIGDGYISDNLLKSIEYAPIVRADDDRIQYNYLGVYARVNYNYLNKYIINLSARRDGSSRFGPGKQFGNFGAVGVAWIFTEEKWLKDLDILSFGKLRASYGITGSDNIRNYQFLSSWTGNTVAYQSNKNAYIVTRHFNPDLQWQSDRKIDVGLNFGLFKDRLNFELTYYRNRMGNQLLDYDLPAITGFNMVTLNMAATVENKGYEGTLTTRIIENGHWSLSSHFNVGLNRNKLLSFPGLEQSPYAIRYTIGKPLNVKRTLKYTGVDKQTGQYTYLDANGDGEITNQVPTNIDDLAQSDFIVIKNLSPNFDGGFGTALTYKNVKLDLSFHFRRQTIRNAFAGLGIPGSNVANIPLEFLDRWQKPGDNAKYARFTAIPVDSDIFYELSDASYTNMYFIRLNNAVLSYNLPENWLKKIGARTASIYAQGQNLLTFTNFAGVDPEVPRFGERPTFTTFVAGLQLTF